MPDNPLSSTQVVGQVLRVLTSNAGEQNVRAIGEQPTPTAGQIAYTPAVPADWGVTPPSNVADALDRLAAVNAGTTTNAGAIGPTGSAAFDSAAITSLRSGVYLVQVQIQFNSNASTATLQLRVDGVAVGPIYSWAISGGGGPPPVSLNAPIWLQQVVSVNPAVTHTFGVQTTGAGITVDANRARVTWVEL